MPETTGRAERRSRAGRAAGWLLPLAVTASGCGSSSEVVRVYDGRIVAERYIAPEAYATFLRGVLAEEAGDFARALAEYERVRGEDSDDPEVFARIGSVRCRLNPRDAGADEAFAKARVLDATYAGALAAESKCALIRGQGGRAAALAAGAAKEDPGNVRANALLVKALAQTDDPHARARAVELTVRFGTNPASWDALLAWGKGHGDAELMAQALTGLLRVDTSRATDVERGIRELLGAGQLVLARTVAASHADLPREKGGRGPRDAVVARLAVDEALARGDESVALRRASRGHVAQGELAARAALLGQRELAERVARAVADADPGASGARMVLTALGAPADPLLRVTDEPPEICALLLAERLATTTSAEIARDWFLQIGKTRMPAGDPLAGPLAVNLAARAIVPDGDLTTDLRLELSTRRRETPPPLQADTTLDAKHTFLFFALTQPRGKEAVQWAARLAGAADRDPIVAVALSKLVVSGVTGIDAAVGRVRQAATASPWDAGLLAAVVELDARAGVKDGAAKKRLMAVARTPAERALASE